MDMFKKAFKYAFGFGTGICAVMAISLSILLVFLAVLKHGPQETGGNLDIHTEHAVGVVELTGEIFSSEKFVKSLDQMLENKSVKAIVVRIDSPGGAVGPSEEMYRAIHLANAKKPVVCSLGAVAASGGLFAAVGCKKIVANESTITGSIGVIMMSPNVHTLLERFGVQMTVVKAGRLKDTGSPFREPSTEDREYLQSLLNTTHDQFIRTVADGRNLKVEDVRKFADGRIILGGQAKELGLVDEIGGLPEAAKTALQLAGDSGEPEIVRQPKPISFFSMLQGAPDSEALSSWFSTRLLFQAFL